jgi:hypothetical protein
MEKKNREQRRREKFGHTGGVTKEPWPQSEANPAFSPSVTDSPGEAPSDPAAHKGRPDQDVTHDTGPGTGGETEGPDRIADREGIHGSNTQKS